MYVWERLARLKILTTALSQTFAISESDHAFVILGRSKERSDAAQTLGSMPLRTSAAAVRNSALPRSSANVTAWILWSSPRMTNGKVGAPPQYLPTLFSDSFDLNQPLNASSTGWLALACSDTR
ncbi:hypothetical protein EJ066_28755 [Mesorhizobium sp. M9A.F.Ca.ET.002.03.1.2]|nr:hypothetical protein EJ066_28755 [Mesorhizobium sp. M9A.F.Ca.ET.002.03.1.2]